MDPIERINIRGDSTFALLLEAQQRGHSSPITRPTGSLSCDGKLFAPGRSRCRCATRPATISRWAKRSASRSAISTSSCCGRTRRSISNYITTTHLLERIHPKTLVVNDPAQRAQCAGERCSSPNFPQLMPPTLITRDLTEIKAFRAEHDDIVMKPLYGNGGEAVFRLDAATISISVRSTTCSP